MELPSGKADGHRDIDLVLVTGAGASREFGVNGAKLPLMGDWSDELCSKLQANFSYLKATGLSLRMLGDEFEAQLGKFLTDVESFRRIAKLLSPTLEFPPGSNNFQALRGGVLDAWHENASFHLDAIIDLIRQSLYEQFAEKASDLVAASSAYLALFRVLGVDTKTPFVYATTNYDTIAEYAIRQFGCFPDWGQPPADTNTNEAPLDVTGLASRMGRFTPVLHLHGRVGWYRRDDGRVYCSQVIRHDKGYGVPIVMLPDPDKVYDTDDIINTLWAEFQNALGRAQRVFVLGHSLNDAFLVRSLQEHVEPYERLAVSVLSDESSPDGLHASAAAVKEKIRDAFGEHLALIPMRFGAGSDAWQANIAAWTSRLQDAALLG